MQLSPFTVTDGPGGGGGSWFPNYIFRDPNRPASLNAGDCSVEVTATDGGGRSRKVRVNVYVIWNKKAIRSLEEKKQRQWGQ
jgi:hypothetical protein